MTSYPSFDPENCTVRDIIALYMGQLRERVAAGKFSEQTLGDLARELERFAVRFGHQRLNECRYFDLTVWLAENPGWQSNHTRKRIVESILRPFLWAEDLQIIKASPYRRPKMLDLKTRPRRAATIAEYVTLMRHGSYALRRALFFMRRTGARTSEMRNLTWDQIHFDEGYIRIEQHKTVTTAADAQPRIIGLEPCVVRFLRNLQRHAGQVGHVFRNISGDPWKDRHVFDRHFRRCADRLGLAKDLKPYSLRHLFATVAIEAGVGERQLADQMGHTSTRLISWYAQTTRKCSHLRNVAQQAVNRQRKPKGGQ